MKIRDAAQRIDIRRGLADQDNRPVRASLCDGPERVDVDPVGEQAEKSHDGPRDPTNVLWNVRRWIDRAGEMININAMRHEMRIHI